MDLASNQEQAKEVKKKEYELSFLLSSLEAQDIVWNELKEQGAEITHQSTPTSIKLAYTIEKHDSAFFGFCHFSVDSAVIEKLSTFLREQEEIIRFLLITPPVKSSPRVPARPRSGRTSLTPQTEILSPKPQAAGLSNEGIEKKIKEILK